MTGLEVRGHKFDEDAVCVDCGFDGAEWHWWRHSTYEGQAQPEMRKPLCTHFGRQADEYMREEFKDNWEIE